MKRTHLALLLILVFACSTGAKTQETAPRIPQPNDFAQVSDNLLIQAVGDAQAAVVANPEMASAWGQLGHVYLAHEWETAAAQCYQRATELEPREFRWFYFLGRSTYKADPKRAVTALSRAIAINGKYAPAHLFFANALRVLNRFDEARREFERVEVLEPGNAYSELGLGELSLADNDVAAARGHLTQALARNPQQSEVHTALAKVYMALGDRKTAKQHALAAGNSSKHTAIPDPLWYQVELAGVTPKWRVYRGRVALRKRDYERALAELSSVISNEQQDPRIWLDYGAALLGNNKYDEAVSALEKALGFVEKNGEQSIPPGGLVMIHSNLGLAYEQLRKIKTAEQHLLAALDVRLPASAPEKVLAKRNLTALYIRIGVAHYQANELERAETFFSKGLKRAPESVLLMNNLAIMYRLQGRLREAIDVLKKSRAVRRDPSTLRMLEVLFKEAGIPAE